MKRDQKVDMGEHKFCPVCGTKLQIVDTFCIRCGYSFAVRAEKVKKKGMKWRTTLVILVLLVVAYFGLRYANGQTLIPRSLADALNTIWPSK